MSLYWLFISKALRVLFIVCCILRPISAYANTSKPHNSSFSLISALQSAYLYNPSLLAAKAQMQATQELLPQAYANWKPTISSKGTILSSENEGSNFGNAQGSTSKDIEFSIDQPIFKGGSNFAKAKGAKFQIKAQRAMFAAIEQDVLLKSVTAYMDVLRDQGLLALSKKNKEVIAQELEATLDRFNVGELTKTDVSQAKARLARAQSEVITAQGNLRSSQAVFEQVIGKKANNLRQPTLSIRIPNSLEESVQFAENNNPEVVASLYAHKAAKEGVDDVFGELLPSIDAFGSWNRSYDPQPGLIDEQTTQSFGLTASIPLYQAGSVRSRVRQAKHEANQKLLEISESKRLAKQEVVTYWEDLQTAKAEIASREAQVEAARLAREGVYAEKDLGGRTILDSLDADQELLDAEIALISAKRNKVVAVFSLSATLGLLTSERLGISEDKSEFNDDF